ncbi:TrbC/VIRB2 family protein [uncultured archaeon]|nr:TrbC/VIRB2 family protein [uncultured archaeon]
MKMRDTRACSRLLWRGYPFLAVIAFSSTASATGILYPLVGAICTLYYVVTEVAGYAATIVLAYAAAKWVISGDDPGQRKAAKEMIIHVLIGLALLTSATEIVKGITGNPGCAP